MKEGYVDIEDILKDIAKEEGMTLKEMKEIWTHQKNYIKSLMDKEDVYAIRLPLIGVLSLNAKQAKIELRGRSLSKYKNFRNKLDKLRSKEKFNNKSTHNKSTAPNNLSQYVLKNYNTGLKDKSYTLTLNKCWDIITKYSNNIFTKIND